MLNHICGQDNFGNSFANLPGDGYVVNGLQGLAVTESTATNLELRRKRQMVQQFGITQKMLGLLVMVILQDGVEGGSLCQSAHLESIQAVRQRLLKVISRRTLFTSKPLFVPR